MTTARNWTPEQKQAIETRGGTLLVSAAAGSGKTAVLVERVIRRITDPVSPCDADRLLVVTFTNAAAAEMKERVLLRLGELLAQNPEDRNLRRQQILLQGAHISTIHSFCLDLIRENFEKLDIEPDFRIADENDARLLRQEALEELLEQAYAKARGQADSPFIALSELLGAGRDDSQLEETILRLYDFTSSLPDPEDWLDEKLRMYNPGAEAGETLWGRAALRQAELILSGAAEDTRASIAMLSPCEKLAAAYGPAFASDRQKLESAACAAKAGDWKELYGQIAGFSFERLGSLRKFEETALRDTVKARRDAVKKTVQSLQQGILSVSEEEFAADCAQIHPLAACLFDLTRELDARFFEKKRERGLLDFSDLERLALRLLAEPVESGGFRPTPAAQTIAKRFDEVLVDEYQDTNPTQDALFRAVSQNGENLFMVGDVKQSIYRFRKATPELFVQKKEAYAPVEAGRFPAKINLGKNFRSRAGVAESVNFVFRQLMTRQFGEMDYNREEELVPGADFFERDGADFALHIVDASQYTENESSSLLEARHIAGVIRGMVANRYPVQGKDGPRPCTYRDFCILLRSASGRAQEYKTELAANGVPVFAEVAGGYLGSYEVAVMLSLLRLLDNPLQDVPLLSVMLSPIFGFTADDAARIRVENRRGSLYLALAAQAKREGGKLEEFVEMLGRLRRLAAVLPADRLILRIYAETGFLNICEAMPEGETRRANLRLLLDYARGYESAGYKGLSGFIRFIDRVGERRSDLAPASAVSEAADVVRIMSIHKSKGLEFPIVFLAGCANRFNKEDVRKPALFHPLYGFGCLVKDEALGCRYPTLPLEVIKIETDKSALAEEMRVLYVAMTRAQEKLIAVSLLKNPDTALQKAASFLRKGDAHLAPLTAANAQSPAEWLLACALRHPSCSALRSAVGMEPADVLPCACQWELVREKAQRAHAADAPLPGTERTDARPETVRALASAIAQRTSFDYPLRPLSKIPSKVAVSLLAENETRETFGFTGAKPHFLSTERLTPAQAGTALHTFMQYADLASVHVEADVEREKERLLQARFLLSEESGAVDAQKVLAFVRSDIGGRMLRAARVFRELRFNLAVDPAELAGVPVPGGRTVVLQGMADIVFEEEKGVVILDYKTDRADAATLRRRYAQQLHMYARAVREVLQKDVTGLYLFGFHDACTVKIEKD